MQRYASLIGVKPEGIAEYERLHADTWPEVLATIHAANIRNYSIYLREPENLLFGYWEYTGSDYPADMKMLGELAVTKQWLALVEPCQTRLASAGADEWWSMMPEVYHLD